MVRQDEWTYLRRVFYGAAERCRNPNHISYKYYGARGVEFKFKSFQEFCSALGHRPVGYTLDRINNDGHYEVGNVRWTTPKQQMKNQRKIPKGSSGYFGVAILNPSKTHPYTQYRVRVTIGTSRKCLYIGKDLDKAINIVKEYYE